MLTVRQALDCMDWLRELLEQQVVLVVTLVMLVNVQQLPPYQMLNVLELSPPAGLLDKETLTVPAMVFAVLMAVPTLVMEKCH